MENGVIFPAGRIFVSFSVLQDGIVLLILEPKKRGKT